MEKVLGVTILIVLAALDANALLKNLKLVAEWGSLDFAFPTPQVREAAIANGQFVAANAVPIDVDVDYRVQGGTRIFVTVPRFMTGIPVTLGTLGGVGSNGRQLIQPYPEYSWHSSHGATCDGLTSVFRIFVSSHRISSLRNGIHVNFPSRSMSVVDCGCWTLAKLETPNIVLHIC